MDSYTIEMQKHGETLPARPQVGQSKLVLGLRGSACSKLEATARYSLSIALVDWTVLYFLELDLGLLVEVAVGSRSV